MIKSITGISNFTIIPCILKVIFLSLFDWSHDECFSPHSFMRLKPTSALYQPGCPFMYLSINTPVSTDPSMPTYIDLSECLPVPLTLGHQCLWCVPVTGVKGLGNPCVSLLGIELVATCRHTCAA